MARIAVVREEAAAAECRDCTWRDYDPGCLGRAVRHSARDGHVIDVQQAVIVGNEDQAARDARDSRSASEVIAVAAAAARLKAAEAEHRKAEAAGARRGGKYKEEQKKPLRFQRRKPKTMEELIWSRARK